MMNEAVPFFSICVPAYKRPQNIDRLLHSIAIQSFKNYEIVITDDSPDDSVYTALQKYKELPIVYFKNENAQGTPANWNCSIEKARGEWVKLMHDDDWFSGPKALETFHAAVKRNPACSFFFSAFQNIELESDKVEVVRCTIFDRFMLWLSPLHLFKRVYVGNPSCTLIRNDKALFYDTDFKFVVDFEYYIRCIRYYRDYQYVDEVLLDIGFHSDQVTKYTFMVAKVQIPENLVLLNKLGPQILRNPVVYDYYWRMFRNLNIRSVEEIRSYYTQPVHPLLVQMLRMQRRIPAPVLKKGVLSKMAMVTSYTLSLFTKARPL
jgi:glycosyltransferase involved in cell wall biosynthesis